MSFFSSKVSAIKFSCPLSVVHSDGCALSQETKVPMCLFLRIIIIYVFIWLHLVLVVAHRIFCCLVDCGPSCSEACRILVADQGSNPGPLQWEDKVLATRPPVKSPMCLLIFIYIYIYLFIYCMCLRSMLLYKTLGPGLAPIAWV